jgi:hypothetical protein
MRPTITRSDVLKIEPPVIDVDSLSKVGLGVDIGSVDLSVRRVVVDVLSNGERQLSAGRDVSVDHRGQGRSGLFTRDERRDDGSNVGVVDP